MRTKNFNLRVSALSLFALPLLVNHAQAAEYYLKAAATTVSMPDPSGTGTVSVAMWGYARCRPGFGFCAQVTVPGPELKVPAGETTLTVHLSNTLNVPTSLVINGLHKPMAPEWTIDAQGRRRVQSFDAEASAGNIQTYTWSSVRPGTYLYQSGTQPQVQVQMGLYGAMNKNAVDPVVGTPVVAAVRGEAYAGALFDNQATLLYSEIDPTLHAAVADGSYGTTGPTSTFDYQPKYFLINGKPYDFGTPAIEPAGDPGTTLLRVLNAGLTTHVPMIQGKLWDVIAEDGKAYTYRRTQYTALLPAAKTLDLLLAPVLGGGTFPIIDRRLSLSNAGLPEGGMMAFLKFGSLTSPGASGGSVSTNLAPVANPDSGYETIPGVALNIAAPGVLANDTDADSPTIKAVAASGTTSGGGKYTLNANGSFTYEPLAGFGGSDTFQYNATDGQALSNTATVTIGVTAPTLPSLGVLDEFDRSPASALLNASPCDACWSYVASSAAGASVQVDASKAVVGGLGGRAIYTTEFLATQGASISSASLANTAVILKATGGTPVAGPANFIRVSCEPTGEVIVATMMGGSSAAMFVKQGAFPAPGCNGGGTLTAKVNDKSLVSVWLGGGFVGGVQLPDVGAWKGPGKIGIQLQAVGATIETFNGGTL